MNCLLTGCLPNYDCLAAFTITANKLPYCHLHGYRLELCGQVSPPYRNGKSHASGYSWSRLARMLELVESGRYEWVYCVGCDTMITNFWIGLEDLVDYAGKPNGALPQITHSLPPGVPREIPFTDRPLPYEPDGRTHVIFACDRASVVQADSFLVRGSTQGAAYLRDILATYPVYQTQPWVEQQAMADLRHRHAAITRIVPQGAMNSYDYSLYQARGPYYHLGVDCYGNRGQWKPGDFLIHWPSTPLSQRLELAQQYSREVIR